MKIPGPDHPIDIAPHSGGVRVTAGGAVLGETTSALALAEARYPAVLYVPRDDIDMSRLRRTERRTTCPYKGEASYYSILGESGEIENAVWSYEEPYPAMQAIKGHLAFYPDKVALEGA